MRLNSFKRFLEKQLKELIESEQNLPRPRITPEQIEAGAESFNVLGDFNTIDEMCRTYPVLHEDVVLWSYSIVFNILYKNNLNSIFESKYSDIMTRKAGQK